MTPTDTLPSNSDRAATQAVDSVRLPTGRRYPNNLPLELNRFISCQLREALLVLDNCEHLNF